METNNISTAELAIELQPTTSFERDEWVPGGEEQADNAQALTATAVVDSFQTQPHDIDIAATSPTHPAPTPLTEDVSRGTETKEDPIRDGPIPATRPSTPAAQQSPSTDVDLHLLTVRAGNILKTAEVEDDTPDSESQDNIQPQPVFSGRRDDVQLVEIRNPEGTGWSAMSKTVREYDEEEIKYYKEDIDTLLVFAGLYSAVLSAFIIESYKFLQPDTEDKMVFLFQKMLSQNYTMSNGFLNATNPYPQLPDFEAPTWAIRVNVLWFSSLVVSLAAASYGMLVKQWLREYLDLSGNTSPQERLRARQYRRPALDHWKVFEIAASLPLLLEIALGLFFIGLCYFTTAIHASISRSTIPFVAAWAFFFIVATVAPLVSPRCPFKTTILRAVLSQGRKVVLRLARAGLPLYFALRKTASSLVRAIILCANVLYSGATYIYGTCSSVGRYLLTYVRKVTPASISRLLSNIRLHLPVFGTDDEIASLSKRLVAHMLEEKMILREKIDDMEVLRSVEEIMPGDGLLPTVTDIAATANPPWHEALALIKTIIDNRTGRFMDLSDRSTWIESLQPLSQQSCDALTTWVSSIIARHRGTPDGTLDDEELYICTALYFSLIFSHDRPIPELRERALYDVIFHCRSSFPAPLFHLTAFTGRLQEVFTESGLKKWRLGVTSAECTSAAENLILQCNNIVDMDGDLYGNESHWIVNALLLLVAQWTSLSSRNLPTKHRTSSPFTNRLVEKLLDELCRIERRGRIYGIDAVRIDVFYGILLGGATTSEWGEWQYPQKLLARSLTSICRLVDDQPYRQGKYEDPTSPKTAFLKLMKSHSETWMATLLGWLAPERMPGNILAEIVAADLAACEPEEQRRKLDDIVHIFRIASLEISPPESYSMWEGIDFSTLLQIVILLQRYSVLDGDVSKEKVHAVQAAFRTAAICRHGAYKMLIKLRVSRKEYDEALSLGYSMRRQRIDLVYAMSYGCYRESGWAGVMNQHIRESDWGKHWLAHGSSIKRLRFVVGDAWLQHEQRKAKRKVSTRRKSSQSLILPAESSSADH